MLWRNYGIVALLYLVAGCWLIWPVPQNLDGMVVGGQHTDIWSHLWGYWRTERDVLNKGIIPYEEPFLNYPYGGRLYHVDLLNSFYMLPLTGFFGRIAGYNILVLLHIIMAGVAIFALLYHYTKTWLSILCSPFCIFRFLPQFPLSSGSQKDCILKSFPPICGHCSVFTNQNAGFYNCIFDDRCPSFGLATTGCWHYGLFVF